MKTLLLFLGSLAVLPFTACTTVEESHSPAMHSSTTTTTEETTTTRRPTVGATTETQTIRRY